MNWKFDRTNLYFFFFALCLFVASCFSLGYHHVDEHFQILEFAYMKLGKFSSDLLPWEYANQMRPSLQPWLVVVLYQFYDLFGEPNPFLITLTLRLLSATLTFFIIRYLFLTFKDQWQTEFGKKWFILLSLFTWFVLYNGVRFSSENWSLLSFAFGFFWYVGKKPKTTKSLFCIGLLMGLSFAIRFQSGFMIAGFVLWTWFIERSSWKNSFFLINGILLITIFSVIIDTIFYGDFTISSWNYINNNVLKGKVESFGHEPWHFYFTSFLVKGIPPYSLFIGLGTLLYFVFKPKSILTWTLVPFIGIHCLFGHKELRFLYPIVIFLPLMILEVYEVLHQKYAETKASLFKVFGVIFKIGWYVNLLFVLIICFKSANYLVPLYQDVYKHSQQKTTLYYLDQNPYDIVTGIRYYKSNHLQIKQINSLDEIPKSNSENQLIALTNKDSLYTQISPNYQVIHSSFPEVIRMFNFNNWLDRTTMWFVYDLKKKKN